MYLLFILLYLGVSDGSLQPGNPNCEVDQNNQQASHIVNPMVKLNFSSLVWKAIGNSDPSVGEFSAQCIEEVKLLLSRNLQASS